MKKGLAYLLIMLISFMLVSCNFKNDNNTSDANTLQEAGEHLNTRNCMLDVKGNIMVKCEDGYKLYTYDKFPEIPGNLTQIIQMLYAEDNTIYLYYLDKLHLSYVLEESKCRMVGGNDVDIFNISIDMEKDIVSFSVENLTFYDIIDDDYRPHLFKALNLLFGENGEEIYHFLMELYEQPIDGREEEILIDGMRVTYRCTPKHLLDIYLVTNNNSDIKQSGY